MKTLSIGIPVHNESANIKYLLESIIRQQQSNFALEKIYVVCDGTTDGTEFIVAQLAKKDKRIILKNDKLHKGKMKRLMEIYAMNTSDYLAIFDGDVTLAHPDVLENMLKGFKKKVVILSANNQPVPAENFVGKIINQWSHIWYLARSSYREGDSIYNVRGCGMALEKQFAKTIIFPPHLISEAQYIYFLAKMNKHDFAFVKDAIILYRKPTTVQDYFLQSKRATSESEKLASIFGSEIKNAYTIPWNYKALAVARELFFHPFITVASAVFTVMTNFLPYDQVITSRNGSWKEVKSTKKAISLISF